MIKFSKSVKGAPKAVGPYSLAVTFEKMLFISGQIPIDPATGELAGPTIKEQARQAFDNLKMIITELGSNMESVLKTTIFLTDMSRFSEVNEIYSEYFQSSFPARSCVEVSNLPKGSLIEIEAIAVTDK